MADAKQKLKLTLSDRIHILFDEKQLRQVLINLIRNALRHNAADAEYIEINVDLKDGRTCIDVIDFGTGVAKRDISQLFKPFLVPKLKELV